MSPLPKRAPTARQVAQWQRLREHEGRKALGSVERERAISGAQLVAQAAAGALVYPPQPRERIRWPQRLRNRWTLGFAQLVFSQQRDFGARSVVITFDQVAELAGCCKNSAEGAVNEAVALGLVEKHRWFDGAPEDETRRTATGKALKHLQRPNHYTIGPHVLEELAQSARARGANARSLARDVERLKRSDAAKRRAAAPENQDPKKWDPTEDLQPDPEVDRRAREKLSAAARPIDRSDSRPLRGLRPTGSAERQRRRRAGADFLCARLLALAERAAQREPLDEERPPGAEEQAGRPSGEPRRKGPGGGWSPGDAHHARNVPPVRVVVRERPPEGSDSPPDFEARGRAALEGRVWTTTAPTAFRQYVAELLADDDDE